MSFWKKDRSLNKFGHNSDVGSTEVDIWEGNRPYNWLDVATRLYISSSSNNDNFNGSGARTITRLGLNEDWNEDGETLPLNGQSRVLADKLSFRTFRAKTKTAGSGGKNEGTIFIHDSTVTAGVPDELDKVYAIISPGHNRTLMAIWTGPANKSFYLADWWASMKVDVGVAKAVDVHLYIRPPNGVFELEWIFHLSNGANNWNHDFKLPLQVPPRSDVTVRAHVSSGPGVALSAGFSGWYGI